MFLRAKSLKIKLMLYSISLSIGILFSTTLIFYILISNLWRDQDREHLIKQSKVYTELYHKNELTNQTVTSDLMLQIVSTQGENKFAVFPHIIEDEDEIALKNLSKDILFDKGFHIILLNDDQTQDDFFEVAVDKLTQLLLRFHFINLASLLDDDLFEIYVKNVDSDHYIVMGRISEEREEILADLRYVAGLCLLPCLLITLILSFFMTRIFLNPIIDFIQVIKRIRSGEKTLRPLVSKNQDELDDLKLEFTALINQNDSLISSLKNTLDNVAHDLRTPLTRFRMQSELALTQSSSVDEIKEALGEGIEASDHILLLLKNLMDIQEIESGVFHLKKEKIEISTLLDEVVDMYQFLAEEKEILLENNAQELFVSIDRLKMFQVFSNLIDNAIKFSKEKSIIKISSHLLEDYVSISIKDQGIGISEEEQTQVWERLYRSDQSRSQKGAGIGLSLVKAFTEAHQGHVQVHSKINQGSEFIVTLPIRND